MLIKSMVHPSHASRNLANQPRPVVSEAAGDFARVGDVVFEVLRGVGEGVVPMRVFVSGCVGVGGGSGRMEGEGKEVSNVPVDIDEVNGTSIARFQEFG